MPRDKLEEIINDFKIEDFVQFFRLKTQAQGNFRLSNERLSQYNDLDLSGLIKLGQIEFSTTEKLIIIGAEVKRDLSERSGKKNQYEKAKKILKELAVYSAGIFIFHDALRNFRFSLVYPEAAGRRREWSSFRRFTYFVSKEFTNKTFLSRIGDGDFSSSAKIKDAFSVEKVTKEFYLEYRKLFESLLGELSKNHTFKNEASRNGLNPDNFAKKLLGQIVFLYFVQKKGWLGVSSGSKWGEGNKNFMGDLFREAIKKNANFYNDYLEKLFYNALNNPRRNSVDPSFSKDFNCRIPFLNGGLFEAEYDWEDSLMCLNNNIFKEIFDVFERYNFTIEEESPDDKEIAVDPEMLGQVFENLLPENLRKGKGTYYTPREIVYYMCRESLINYLVSNHSNIAEKNIRNYIFYSESFENFREQKGESFIPGQWKELDDLLKNIKVCDPACGSGAFLVGMLNLIIKLRIYLQTTPDSHLIPQKTEYELKKEAIQNCIYGVDIDPGAIEIAKLRLWLSLVVDYNVEDIEPLPNLDYRLMCGNSLLEEYEGVKFYNGEENRQQAILLTDAGKQEKVAELKKKVKEYFDIHDDKEKQTKRKEINDIKDWLVRSALEKRKQEISDQIKKEKEKTDWLNQKSRDKYLASWGDKFLAEAKIKEVLDNLHNPKKEKPFFIWKLEFIDVFEDKKGFDVVIANPPYITYKGKQRVNIDKKEIAIYQKSYPNSAEYKINSFALFLDKGTQLLSRVGIISYIIPSTFLQNEYLGKIRKYLLSNFQISKVITFGNKVFEAVTDSVILFVTRQAVVEKKKMTSVIRKNDLNFLPDDKVLIFDQSAWLKSNEGVMYIRATPHIEAILEKIEKVSVPLDKYFEANIGIKRAKAPIVDSPKMGHKKFLVGRDIDKYKLLFDNKYILFKKELFHTSVDERIFLTPEKVLVRKTGDSLIAAYDNEQYYTDQSIYNVYPCGRSSIEIKFVLGLLNSSLMNFYFQQKMVTNADVYPYIKGIHLKKLPIKEAMVSSQKVIIDIVNKILAITKSSDYLENPTKQAKVKEYEKQIDQMVYKLYGLTPEEIKIIEGY